MDPNSVLRRTYLSSDEGARDFQACTAAWQQLITTWRIARPTSQHVRIPLAWMHLPSWQGAVGEPTFVGKPGRPTGPYQGSVITTLASGGADALPLRVLLTVTAVWSLAQATGNEASAASIPLTDSPGETGVSWATLTMVGPSRPKRTNAPTSTTTTTRPSSRTRTQRRRMRNAVQMLEHLGLVTVRTNRAGEITGLEPTAIPDPIEDHLRDSCHDASVPLSLWLKGWNATLWGDELVLLLMYLCAPHQPLYARPWILNGATIHTDASTRPGPQRITVGAVKFLSERKRHQQFGVHDARHRKMTHLHAFGIAHMKTAPVPPLPVRQALNRKRAVEVESAMAGTGDPSAAFLTSPTPLNEGEPSAAASYTIDLEAFTRNARLEVVTALL